jgi:glyoxylase-like metal-dependent hydrolase (beta-lactamase superfamily II)
LSSCCDGIVLPVAPSWFTVDVVSPVLTLIREPHVRPLLAANTWVVRGRDRDLFVDCGLGVASLRTALPDLFERSPAMVATHGHLDHLGGAHEFDQVLVHRAEQVDRPGRGSLEPRKLAETLGAPTDAFGDELLLSALPSVGYDPTRYHLRPVMPTRHIAEGEVIDLGDLTLRVMHLPGHTPGSVALYEPDRRWLFSGDVVYDDDELIDFLAESSRPDYQISMHRLLELDVDLVMPGHDDTFGRERLAEIAEGYLRGARQG